MNDTSRPNKFTRTFNLPYQLGIYLAANAVSDSCVVVDGLNCVMPKIDFLAGNHDLNSTLLSPEGGHRVICTMTGPLPQGNNPEKKLSALLQSVAGSKDFAVIMLTGLPFLKLAGIDYEGLAAGVTGGSPVTDVPARSFEADWLEGYDLSLDALVRALPERKVKKKKRTVALAGYFLDRNERDHAANIEELRRLLGLCGLELTCVFPSGGNFAGLSRALEAEVVVSLPYGRRAASRLAARSGARLVETGLPMGFKGTARWLEAVRLAAGLKGELPPAVKALEKQSARAIAPVLETLAHINIVYAGDPYLFAAFSAFASELGMRVNCALIDSFIRPLDSARLPGELLFSPDIKEAAAAVKNLGGYLKPDLVVGNSFAITEGLTEGLPLTELGFPSYGHHCLSDEPFLGFAGARTLACRLFNSLRSDTAGK
jgi:nitrogenase molybdenum-iron protein alpha/beta subunit